LRENRNWLTFAMAAMRRALPRRAMPVLVIKLGHDGSLSIISSMHSVGGGGFDKDDEAIVQLYNEGKRSKQKGVIKSPSRQDGAQREYLRNGHVRSCT